MTDPVLAEVIEPSVLRARRAARVARDLADTLADARREAMDAERSALAALRTVATDARIRTTRLETLEADLAGARHERDALEAGLLEERRIREGLERRLAEEEARRAALAGELKAVRAEHEALVAERDGLRAQRDRLVTELRDAQRRADGGQTRGPARDGAPPSTGPAALSAAPADARSAGSRAQASLQALAAQQVAAAEAAARAQGSAPGRPSVSATAVTADLERAAAALRARRDAPPEQKLFDAPSADAPLGAAAAPSADAPLGAAAAPSADAPLGAFDAPSTGAPLGAAAALAPAPQRPSATRGPVAGVSVEGTPSLRAALARFAHGNPAAAGILLAGLLPAQGALVGGDLDYDLTIRGTGTYAVTLRGGTASVRALAAPRRRNAADLQLTAEPAALAELLLGSRRVGRLNRDLRFRGRRRALELLEPVVHAELSLADAILAGARLDPVAALLALAVAVPAPWTRGHRFTVEHVIEAGQVRRVFLHARDGAGLHAATSFGGRADATIRFTPEIFHQLLRGERPAPGMRPHVRGNRTAVAALRTWADRVLGR